MGRADRTAVGVDLDPVTRILTVCCTAVELNPKFHPEGRRFSRQALPEDKEEEQWGHFRVLQPDTATGSEVTGMRVTERVQSVAWGPGSALAVGGPGGVYLFALCEPA
jgi:hypothetical protein